MSLTEHLALLRSGLRLIAISVMIAVLAAAAVSSALPRRYAASATLYVGQSLTEPSFDYGGLLASQLLAPTYARLATTSELLGAVASRLELGDDLAALSGRVEADVPAGGTLITITAVGGSPTEAAALANAVADELLVRAPAERSDQPALEEALAEVETDIDDTRQALLQLLGQPTLTEAQQATATQLQQRLETLQSTRDALSEGLTSRSPNALTLVDAALPPESAAGPSRTIIVGTAGVTALAAAVLLIYVLAGLRRPEDETPAT